MGRILIFTLTVACLFLIGYVLYMLLVKNEKQVEKATTFRTSGDLDLAIKELKERIVESQKEVEKGLVESKEKIEQFEAELKRLEGIKEKIN